jgi:hypothetical protein
MNWTDQLERWRCTDEWPTAIFDAVLKLVPRMCRSYDARLYSPLRVWNEDAYRTLAVDAMAMLKAGYVRQGKYAGRCECEIRAYMAAIIRSLMESTAARQGARRRALNQKLRRILRQDRCFRRFASGWGLQGWVAPEAASTLARSQTRLRRVRADSSYLPSEAQLREFIWQLMNAIGGPVTFRTVVRATQVHFGVVDLIECSWPIRRDPETGLERQVEFEDPRANIIEVEVQTRDAVQKFLQGFIQAKAPRAAGDISLRKKAR